MKSIFLLLAFIGLTFASCKKESPAPDPSNSITTPTSPTDTTTVVANDSTNADGSAKTKIFFSVRLPDVITSVRDYKYDTLNVRMYHNTNTFKIHKINYNGTSGNIVNFNNYSALTGTSNDLTHPVWMNSGDSLVVEMDSLEFIQTPYNDVAANCKLMVKKLVSGVLTTVSTSNIWDSTLPLSSIYPYLGSGQDSGTAINKYWCLGRKVRVVYILP